MTGSVGAFPASCSFIRHGPSTALATTVTHLDCLAVITNTWRWLCHFWTKLPSCLFYPVLTRTDIVTFGKGMWERGRADWTGSSISSFLGHKICGRKSSFRHITLLLQRLQEETRLRLSVCVSDWPGIHDAFTSPS